MCGERPGAGAAFPAPGEPDGIRSGDATQQRGAGGRGAAGADPHPDGLGLGSRPGGPGGLRRRCWTSSGPASRVCTRPARSSGSAVTPCSCGGRGAVARRRSCSWLTSTSCPSTTRRCGRTHPSPPSWPTGSSGGVGRSTARAHSSPPVRPSRTSSPRAPCRVATSGSPSAATRRSRGGRPRTRWRILRERGVEPWFVIDEGGAIVEGVLPGVAAELAVIGVSEKGTVDVDLTARGDGGHASAPRRGGATARLARAITRLERRPFPAHLPDATVEMMEHASAPTRVCRSAWSSRMRGCCAPSSRRCSRGSVTRPRR